MSHRSGLKRFSVLTTFIASSVSSFSKTCLPNKKYAHSTALSKYVWDCKDKIKQTPEISWKIVKSAPAYTNTSKRCVLCLEEKMTIITYPDQEKLLNKRSELISKCRHENKFLLKYYDSND